MKLWLDCESIGLCGPVMLIQYALDDGPVQFIRFDGKPPPLHVLRYLGFLLYHPEITLIAFNSAFDLFKLYQTIHHYLHGEAYDSSSRPVPPFLCKTLDLYVPATQRSPLSSFAFGKSAGKSVAAVRKIPVSTVDLVANRVEDALRPHLPASVKLNRSVHEVKGRKDLATVSWSVEGRLSLKNLMREYGLPTLKLDEVWPLPEKGVEKPWLPYPDPAVHGPIEAQCRTTMSDPTSPFWAYSELDIHFLRVLYEKLGQPAPDHHSVCTAAVAYTRYYGFPVDRGVLLRTKTAYEKKIRASEQRLAGINLRSAPQRLALLRTFDPLVASSRKAVVQALADTDRPCAPTCRAMLDFGQYTQRLLQVEKVLECRTGRAHPSLRVMGTRTGRMAGEAGLNWQGICQAKKGIGLRAAIGTVSVGDWSSFEVAIAAAAFPDGQIQRDLDDGIDPHSMNVALMHPQAKRNKWTYEQVKALVDAKDPIACGLRKGMKAVTFGLAYFCTANKVAEVLGISVEEAEGALDRYYRRFSGFAAYKDKMNRETCTADTEHWSRESVGRMKCTMTDLTGYEMRWDFERQVATILWQLGGTGIQTGKEGTVIRNSEKGRQTIDGAIRSALLGGAIAIQQAVMRQRGNARVQATGANLTKMLMAELWEELHTPSLSVHDELVFGSHSNYDHAAVTARIESFTARWKRVIPSLFFDFKATSHWSDK